MRGQMHMRNRLVQSLSAFFDHLFLFFGLDEKLFLFFDDLSLETADNVNRGDDDDRDQQNDLNAVEVADQLFNAGGERETEPRQQSDPDPATCERQRRKP